MLTLKNLKEQLVEIPKKGAKIPTYKAIRESEVPVFIEKLVQCSESVVRIIVYANGYVVYQIENRITVFPVNAKEGYCYKTVEETSANEERTLSEDFFDNQEWYWKLMLLGEDRLAHNLAGRDKARCISYSGMPEECEFMEDRTQKIVERIARREQVKEMLGVLNKRQKQVVKLAFWGQKTHKQIAEELGMKSRTAVTNMLNRALKKMEDSFYEDGQRK
jgi:RNA polymerase sigma factor (sigma-70 family)